MLKKFDTNQIAEILFVAWGTPLTEEELIALDEDPDAKPNTSKPELKRGFEIIFRFWNSQYGRLSYFPRAPFDHNCGALWFGSNLESVVYADVTEANVPVAQFITAKKLKPISTPIRSEAPVESLPSLDQAVNSLSAPSVAQALTLMREPTPNTGATTGTFDSDANANLQDSLQASEFQFTTF